MIITFTGDILIYQSQDKGCLGKNGCRDYSPIFEQVKPLLKDSDYVVGSFETTLAGVKSGYTKSAISFNTPDELLLALKDAGFDMLTTANNHCLDRGEDGLRRTILKIKEAGLEYTGTRVSEEEPAYLVKKIDGTTVAFLAYTYGTNSDANGYMIPKGKEYLVNLTRPQDTFHQKPLWKRIAKAVLYPVLKTRHKQGVVVDCVPERELNSGRNEDYEKQMLDTIRKARKEADVVIVCLHSGGQFNSEVGAYTQHLFDLVSDAGVDAIVCNHAHKILPVYKKGDCIIASALGNFSFAPGEGYWVDGVNVEYSALLVLEIVDKKIVSFKTDICKCVHNEKGLAITVYLKDIEEIDTINNNLRE